MYLFTFCISFTHLLHFKSGIMLALLLLLRDTTHVFAILVKNTLPWKPSICDVVHSDVQVRMKDSKTRQNFMHEKVEKLY